MEDSPTLRPVCPEHGARRERRGDVVVCLDCGDVLPRIYSGRNSMHKNMGPPEYYSDCCGGRGYYPGGTEDGPNDLYCDCAAGIERRRVDP